VNELFVKKLLEFYQYCLDTVRDRDQQYGSLWESCPISDLEALLRIKARKLAAKAVKGTVNIDDVCDVVNYFIMLEVRRGK